MSKVQCLAKKSRMMLLLMCGYMEDRKVMISHLLRLTLVMLKMAHEQLMLECPTSLFPESHHIR